MSSTTHMLERDMPPFIWAGSYDSILRYGGDKHPLINELREVLSGKFIIVLKLYEINSNLYVNGKPCLVRKRKQDKITVYPNCKIIEGTDLGYGGSNSYPHISFKEEYAVVEVTTNGFPNLELNTYNMKIEILDLRRLK